MKKKIKLTKALKKVCIEISKAVDDDKSAVEAFGIYMLDEWTTLAKKVIAKSDDIKATEKSVDSFLKYCDSEMEKFGDEVESDIHDYIDFIYKFSKEKFIKDKGLELVEKADLPVIESTLWIEQDTAAIKSLERITGQSTGKFYKTSVMETVHNSVKKNVFENPSLTHAEAVEIMQKDLSKALKLSKGKLASKVVPKGFHGTANQYFSGLAKNSATLARTSSTIYTIKDVGAKYVVVRSVRTSRTCVGCLAIDGQKYKTADAVSHLEKILSMDDISEYKDIQPSFHFTTKDKSTPEQLMAAQSIKESGAIHIPPHHFRCECYTDMG